MKVLVAILLSACVAMTMASDCDDLTVIKVRSQWYRAYSHGHSREHFAEAVWRTFFNLEPEARKALEAKGSDDTSSGAFRAYALNSLAHLELAVTFLDKPEPLAVVLNFLHKQHVDRHAPDSFVTSFIKALGHVVPAQLGRCWDKEAWKACFKIIGDGIKNGVPATPEVGHH
jgi:hypothetical protein